MTVDLLSFLNKLGILLNNIRSHSSRKHKAIRTRIENLVVVVLALSEASNSIPSHSVHTPQFSKLLENVLDALPEVIKTRNGKLCEGALGVYEMLVRVGFVRGQAGGGEEYEYDNSTNSTNIINNDNSNNNDDDKTKTNIKIKTKTNPTNLSSILATLASIADSTDEPTLIALCCLLPQIILSPTCQVHSSALLTCVRSAFHVYLVNKSEGVREKAREALGNIVVGVLSKMEEVDEKFSFKDHAISEPSNSSSPTSNISFLSKFHKDAFLLFRALCKLSSKALPLETSIPHPFLSSGLFASDKSNAGANNDDTKTDTHAAHAPPNSSSEDPLALSSKILSLSLLLQMVSAAGTAFLTNDKFVFAVVHFLCPALLKNCTSSSTPVLRLSLRIFVTLITSDKFRTHLKQEVEVFVSNIFLPVLNSENSSKAQKILVLEALQVVCGSTKTLATIFFSFDCDLNGRDMYKEIINEVARVAKGTRNGKGGASIADYTPLTATTVAAAVEAALSLSGDHDEYGNWSGSGSGGGGGKGGNLREFLTKGKSGTAKREVGKEAALRITALEVVIEVLGAMCRAQGLALWEMGEVVGISNKLGMSSTCNSKTDIKSCGGKTALEKATKTTEIANSPLHPQPQPTTLSPPPTIPIPESSTKNNQISSSTIISTFNQKKNNLEDFATGIIKFKLNLKAGIIHFADCNFVKLEAKAVAIFLFVNREKLDKTQIGEVLGKEPEYAFIKDPSAEPAFGGPGFCVRILYEYVDNLDFKQMQFDEAIRFFLEGFRLPGEAQKIDRIMEKFAEQYTLQNEAVFSSADTAFILAFSIIMLNTDLHNPSIPDSRRMTNEGFVRNNRGISVDNSDLPEEFLNGIFERIKNSPFTLKEDDEARKQHGTNPTPNTPFDPSSFFKVGSSSTDEKKRREREYQKEREILLISSESLIKSRYKNTVLSNSPSANAGIDSATTFSSNSPSPAEAVEPMFDVAWGPTIGALSQILEFTEEPMCISMCLIGFTFAIRIASHNDQAVARDTFINSLAKFTSLGSIKEMKQKNIECIKALLRIAISDGELLCEAWAPVLLCISQLSRLQLSASGLVTDEELFENVNDVNVDNPDGSSVTNQRKRNSFNTSRNMSIFSSSKNNNSKAEKAEAAKKMEAVNGRAVLETVADDLIDKVFAASVKLSVAGIEHFISQLILVSAKEVLGDAEKDDAGGRLFALQRLVEVADFNMNERPRIVWTRMWKLMSTHFTNVGCHQNETVSMFAIDSLRQLSFKFLEKPELKDFNFQRLFLEPFLVIMKSSSSREDTRELILCCIDNIIRTLCKNIRSGWKTIFSVLALSASDQSVKISKLGLVIVQRLLDDHMDLFFSVEEDFVCLIQTSFNFVFNADVEGVNPPAGLSMKAICHAGFYADIIAMNCKTNKFKFERGNGKKIVFQSYNKNAPHFTYKGFEKELEDYDEKADGEKKQLMAFWRPLFDGLANGIIRGRGGRYLIIQRACVCTLRAILIRHGNLFSVEQWTAILEQSVLPKIQIGARQDKSNCVGLYSESPLENNFDFLQSEPALPPNANDDHLRECRLNAQRERNSTARDLGVAESLIVASLRDLRIGGDGSLKKNKNHGGFYQKRNEFLDDEEVDLALEDVVEMGGSITPSDSWVASTATCALGMLIDIVWVHHFNLGVGGREVLLPIVAGSIVSLFGFGEIDSELVWIPCEALLRICCAQIGRLAMSLEKSSSNMLEPEVAAWRNDISTITASLLRDTVIHQEKISSRLVVEKRAADIACAPVNRVDDIFLRQKLEMQQKQQPGGGGGGRELRFTRHLDRG